VTIEMAGNPITAKQVNRVLKAVVAMHPRDGDAQLTVLAYALATACKAFNINKDSAMSCLGQSIDEIASVPLKRSDHGDQH